MASIENGVWNSSLAGSPIFPSLLSIYRALDSLRFSSWGIAHLIMQMSTRTSITEYCTCNATLQYYSYGYAAIFEVGSKSTRINYLFHITFNYSILLQLIMIEIKYEHKFDSTYEYSTSILYFASTGEPTLLSHCISVLSSLVSILSPVQWLQLMPHLLAAFCSVPQSETGMYYFLINIFWTAILCKEKKLSKKPHWSLTLRILVCKLNSISFSNSTCTAGEAAGGNWIHCRLQCLALFNRLNTRLKSNTDSDSKHLRDMIRVGFLNALLDSNTEMR